MRCLIPVAKVALLGAAAMMIVSCGTSTQSRQAQGEQSADGERVDDSGRRFSGEFLLSVSDAYQRENASSPEHWVYTFDENGNFKRQDRSRIDEGSYFIGVGNELLVYIEKINGEQLPAARDERYAITEERADSITLQHGPARTLVLRRR